MGIEIVGIDMFAHIGNWFVSWHTTILFAIITFLICFFFYKINFTNKDSAISPWKHYGYNICLLIVYGIMMFDMGEYVKNTDVVYTTIFTIIFYGANITILTIALIVMRRWKIKNWILNKIDNIKKLSSTDIKNLVMLCHNSEHKYLDMFAEDIIKPKIDKNKYLNINIWEDENKNTNESGLSV